MSSRMRSKITIVSLTEYPTIVNSAATVAGWNALALPVRDADGAPLGAVMLAGIAEQFPGTREAALLDMVAKTVSTIEQSIISGLDRKKRISV